MYSEYKKPMWNDSGSESPWLDYCNQYELKHYCFGDDGGDGGIGGTSAADWGISEQGAGQGYGTGSESGWSSSDYDDMDAMSTDAPALSAEEAANAAAVSAHQDQQEAIDEDPEGWEAAQADPSLATDWAGRAIGSGYGYLGTTETGKARDTWEANKDAADLQAALTAAHYDVSISIDPQTGTYNYEGPDARAAAMSEIGKAAGNLGNFALESATAFGIGPLASAVGKELGFEMPSFLTDPLSKMAESDKKSAEDAAAREAERDAEYFAQTPLAAHINQIAAAPVTSQLDQAVPGPDIARAEQARAEARGEGMGGRAPTSIAQPAWAPDVATHAGFNPNTGADFDLTGMPAQDVKTALMSLGNRNPSDYDGKGTITSESETTTDDDTTKEEERTPLEKYFKDQKKKSIYAYKPNTYLSSLMQQIYPDKNMEEIWRMLGYRADAATTGSA